MHKKGCQQSPINSKLVIDLFFPQKLPIKGYPTCLSWFDFVT